MFEIHLTFSPLRWKAAIKLQRGKAPSATFRLLMDDEPYTSDDGNSQDTHDSNDDATCDTWTLWWRQDDNKIKASAHFAQVLWFHWSSFTSTGLNTIDHLRLAYQSQTPNNELGELMTSLTIDACLCLGLLRVSERLNKRREHTPSGALTMTWLWFPPSPPGGLTSVKCWRFRDFLAYVDLHHRLMVQSQIRTYSRNK